MITTGYGGNNPTKPPRREELVLEIGSQHHNTSPLLIALDSIQTARCMETNRSSPTPRPNTPFSLVDHAW